MEWLAQVANAPNLAQNGMTLVALGLLGVLIWLVKVSDSREKGGRDEIASLLRECSQDRRADSEAKVKLAEALARHSNTLDGIGRIIERKI